jgi:hypothetical protein
MLLPASLLSLSEAWSDWLDRMDRRSFCVLCGALIAGLIASIAFPGLERQPGTWGTPAMLVAVVLAVVGATAPLLAPTRRFAIPVVVVVLVSLNALTRHEFLMKAGTPPVLHAPGYIDASQSFDPHRRQCFLAVSECTRTVSRLEPETNVWFWYDLEEPLGPVFKASACTHWIHHRLINSEFPTLPEDRAPGQPGFRPGDKIALLSQDLRSGERARRSFRAGNVALETLGEFDVGEYPVAFRLTIFEVAANRNLSASDARLPTR